MAQVGVAVTSFRRKNDLMSRKATVSSRPEFMSRRGVLQAGAMGLGLNIANLSALRALANSPSTPRAKSVLFIFLTGGLSQHDTFDMKPDASSDIRGEFKPIATQTPGTQVCEHLPLLAQRSKQWSLLRSMQTSSNVHEVACHMLLTGRLDLPAGFSFRKVPSPNDWPSIPAMVRYAYQDRPHGKMPPAVILPEPSANGVGKLRPGQFAGRLGNHWNAWHIDIASKCPLGMGACPDCFLFDGTPFEHAASTIFDAPTLTLPQGGDLRLQGRVDLLDFIQGQQQQLEQSAGELNSHRRQAISVLTDPKVRSAFDVERADAKTLERYGKNKFGLSVLMGKRLIEAGVNLVQVNLGGKASWDTHWRNFVNLKENLLPPLDQCISALLDDMSASGLLEETLVVVTGEFGRSPKINKDAGRDHWGPVSTMLFAGGGVRPGNVIGASDRNGAEPVSDLQTPENFAATIYEALGIPRHAMWNDVDGRPHNIYHGKPISGLMA